MKQTALQRKAKKLNKVRGEAGAKIIQLWINETRARNEDPHYGIGREGEEEAFIDILTNLRHLANIRHTDFYNKLDRSYDHYLKEKSEERMAP